MSRMELKNLKYALYNVYYKIMHLPFFYNNYMHIYTLYRYKNRNKRLKS